MRRANIKLICLIIFISLSLLVSCQLPSVGITTPTPPTTSTPTPIDSGWTPPTPQTQAPVLPSIADVVAKVRLSVVAINTEVINYDILNQPYTQEGAGSGWIIGETGIIVTNNHVVEGAETVTVTLGDNRVFSAETINTDPFTDLAVIKISAGKLSAIPVGDTTKLRVGDWVVAIGNPLGLGISAKEGIISRLGVQLPVSSGQTLQNLIETSAAINPGNSGGPLVNMTGEVVGITSIKIATVGVEGMGYALNINTAAPIIKQLVTTGYVTRPRLGLTTYTVDQWAALRYRLAVNKGVLITDVQPGSPADKAGLKQGDVIVALDDKEIATSEELQQAIYSSQIGQGVKITFWRETTQGSVYATLDKSQPS